MSRAAALKAAAAAVIALAAAYGLISPEQANAWVEALGGIVIAACLLFAGKQDPNQ